MLVEMTGLLQTTQSMAGVKNIASPYGKLLGVHMLGLSPETISFLL